MAKKTSADLVDDLAGLGEAMRDRAIAETRKDIASYLKQNYLGIGRVPGSDAGGKHPDDCILDILEFMSEPQLKKLRERFDREGVSDDFRAGVLFASILAGDLRYEL